MGTKLQGIKREYERVARITERHRELKNEAYDFYDDEYHSNPDYGIEVSAFIDGGEWADKHPSRQTIEKIIENYEKAKVNLFRDSLEHQIDYVEKELRKS